MILDINGEDVEIADGESRLLVWVLRDELGLTGTKFGCGAGICGSCTIHVDGVPTRACLTPVEAAIGKSIRTIEDLQRYLPDGTRQLHPVQQAFLEEQAPQCSWCMSGQMMSALALLENSSNPDETEINSAMRENYCRCGCYARIKKAVFRAAEYMQAEGANE